MDNKRAVQRFFDGMNAGDVSAALTDFEEDAAYWGLEEHDGRLRRKDFVGKKEIHDYLSSFVQLFEPGSLHYEVLSLVVDGSAAMAEWQDVARNKDGREGTNHGVNTWQFDANGKVIRAKSFPNWDTLPSVGYKGRFS